MAPKHLAKQENRLLDKVLSAPGKMKRAFAVVCAAALIASAVPYVNISADAAPTITAKTTATLNVRKGAGTNYAVLSVLDKKASVTVMGVSESGWVKVKLSNGKTGYCAANYLDITTDAKTTAYLNMRKGAGTQYDVIKTLAPDTVVDVLNFKGTSWAYIQLSNGKKGYVCTDYLSFIGRTAAKTTPATASKTNSSASTVSVSISLTSKKLAVGKTYTLTAETNSGGKFKWSSSNKKVATVTSSGFVKAVSVGTATITAKDSKSGKSVKCKITVAQPDIKSVKLAKFSASLQVGESYQIKATTNPEGGKVKYSTFDKSVAKVTSQGLVTAVGPGTTKISVSDTTGTISKTFKVTSISDAKMTISKKTASVDAGASVTLTAEMGDGSAVKWSSSDTSVAAVRGGVVSGLSAGTATITASDGSGTITASCKVTVKAVSSSGISLSRTSATLPVGKTLYIKGYCSKSASWGTSNSAVATVSEGFILAKKTGKVGITYTDKNGNRAICTVSVTAAEPIRFTYSSPNSATLDSVVSLIAITDKSRTKVKFVIDNDGEKETIEATEKKTDGNTYVWTAYYGVASAGTINYKAYSYADSKWSTCDEGKADIYVTEKSSSTETTCERLRASDEVIRFIGEKEGFVSSVTYDTLANNLPTLGYGYVVWEGDRFYNSLTKNEGFALLVSAVNKENYAAKVNDMLTANKVKFNQQQFDSLVSFSYNLGTGWTSSSSLKTILLNSYAPVSSGDKVYGTVTASSGLYLRKGSSTSSDIIRLMSNNDVVTLVSTKKYNSVWYKVKTSDGKTGYCSGTYLTLSGNSSGGRDLNYVNKNSLIKEMLAYHHACGVCYYGLLYRRADELEMFLYGDYASDGRSNKYNFPNPRCISFP